MKITFQVLLSSILILQLQATYAAGSRCFELNSQATALQSGDSCALLRTVVNGGEIFAGNTDELSDATCGFHLEDVVHSTCVEEVVGVVAGIIDEACEVTGGTNVTNFIYSVNDNNEGFALLTHLACKQVGECFADVQRAIENCNENPTQEDCMDYVTCGCLTDLLSVIKTFSDNGEEDFLNLDTAIIGRIKGAGTACRCEDLNYRALSLELSPGCSLAGKIVQDENILAGGAAVVANTCSATTDTTCVEDVVDVVDELIEYGCEVMSANGKFIYTLKYGSEDFEKITDFACNDDCYATLNACRNDNPCIKSISCDCKRKFMAIVEGLTPDSKEDLLKLNAYEIEEMQNTVGECNGETEIIENVTLSNGSDASSSNGTQLAIEDDASSSSNETQPAIQTPPSETQPTTQQKIEDETSSIGNNNVSFSEIEPMIENDSSSLNDTQSTIKNEISSMDETQLVADSRLTSGAFLVVFFSEPLSAIIHVLTIGFLFL